MVINAGETALTFYKATNHEEKPIIGNYKIDFIDCHKDPFDIVTATKYL